MADELFDRLAEVYARQVANFEALLSLDRLSGGASQETYRIRLRTSEGELTHAMRRSPGGVHTEPMPGHPGLPTEARLIQAARAAGVPEPEVYYVLQEADGLGDGFIMEWLEGEALGARINRQDQYATLREHLAFDCGRIMAQIHQIDLETTGLRQNLEEVSPRQFVEQTLARYHLFETPQPMIDYTACWLLDNLPKNYQPSLVHNDFRNGNFMVSTSEIVAVLDWELAHIGDPMRDLGWICVNSWRFGSPGSVGGFGEYEDLFAGYESVTGNSVDREVVKFWEVFGSFWWAVGCLGMAEHYRTGPDQTVERPAIGRRSSECQVDCINLLLPGHVTLVEADPVAGNLDMPRVDELLISVRDFLREEVMPATEGRTGFMARVASNSVDIVLREWALGAKAKSEERDLLLALLSEAGGAVGGRAASGRAANGRFATPANSVSSETLEELRWRLVHGLRQGEQDLEDERLKTYLRQSVVNRLNIDQPKYSGLAKALGYT